MNGTERLVYMANQIAKNLSIQGHDKAAATIADHIAAYWDPRMRRGIAAHVAAGGEGLDPIALDALQRLAAFGAPGSQTPATRFATVGEAGGSDAG